MKIGVVEIEAEVFSPKPGDFILIRLVDGSPPDGEKARQIGEQIKCPVLIVPPEVGTVELVSDKIVPFLRKRAEDYNANDAIGSTDEHDALSRAADDIESGEFLL